MYHKMTSPKEQSGRESDRSKRSSAQKAGKSTSQAAISQISSAPPENLPAQNQIGDFLALAVHDPKGLRTRQPSWRRSIWLHSMDGDMAEAETRLGRLFMKELNNVVAAILIKEAVLSHSFPQPREQLLAAELLAAE